MRCEYQYFRIFDFGGFIDIDRARRGLEGSFLVKGVTPIKGAPEYVSFAPVVSIDFGDRGLFEFENGTPCRVSAKIFELGAVSIQFISEFEVQGLEQIRQYWDYSLRRDGKIYRKSDIAREFFEEIQRKVQANLIDRYEIEVYPEYYTVFSIEKGDGQIGEWVEQNRRQIASLLINEKDAKRLGDREVEEILGARYSYYHDEIAFVDWDATVTIGVDPKGNDDILAVLEAANLQLLELRTYDAYLDHVIDKATQDLRNIFAPGGFFKGRARKMVAELAETRIELEKMVDEINNVAKFFGDWYIARVYLGCRKKLHVDRWMSSVQERLADLGNLYELAASEASNRRMVVLELLIILLFLIDVILIASK